MSGHSRSDFGAALTGLVVCAFLLFSMVFGIVTWTNSIFAHEHHAEAAK